MLAIFLIYNLTEAGYKVTTFMAFTLLVVALERPAEERVENAKPAVGWRSQPAIPVFVPRRLTAQPRLQQVEP
jgi:hypothetical protein